MVCGAFNVYHRYGCAKDIHNVYAVEHPSFFAPSVLVAATEGREFHYGAVGQSPESWLMWGSTADPYDLDGFERVKRSVDLLLTQERVLSILRDFTLFEQVPGGGVRKLIPRYPQVEAAEAILAKVLAGGERGLIWHYQGTGKTLLMAFAALMLLHDDKVGGPTVLVVLDRLDLIEQVQRQFKTAGLNFKSTSYDWLVVSGRKAQYKGTGTINGEGNYKFMLSAIDGNLNGGDGLDKFRIKIWDAATGAVIYDNQLGVAEDNDPTTVIGGGSIIIHK
jgi:hypothetical protein